MARLRTIAGLPEALGLIVLLVAGWFLLGALSAATAAIAVLALYYSVAGLSFSFLQGTLGVFSLAQPVFLLVGGYTDAYLNSAHGVSPWLCIVISIGVSTIIAIPIGLACVRSRSSPILVALVTLIIAEAVAPIVVSIPALGGGLGLLINPQTHPAWTALQFLSPASFAKAFLILNVVLMGLYSWFKRTRWGHWAIAVRDAPSAASAVGIPLRKLSLVLFIVSAVVVAPAGAIYAQYNLNVTTDLFLSTTALFQVSVVALAGGAGRVWGALAGGVIVVYLTQKAGDLGNGHPGLPDLAFALLFLIVALAMPRGISGTWALLVERRKRRLQGQFGSVELVNAAQATRGDTSAASSETSTSS